MAQTTSDTVATIPNVQIQCDTNGQPSLDQRFVIRGGYVKDQELCRRLRPGYRTNVAEATSHHQLLAAGGMVSVLVSFTPVQPGSAATQ